MSDAQDRTYTWNRKTFPISRPDLDDWVVAGKVRMLMREQLDHEAVCVLARDRIMCLVAEKEAQAARIAALEAERDAGLVREKDANASATQHLRHLECVKTDRTQLQIALRAMLNHSCVADAGADMKDPEDHEAERIARAALAETEGE